jgi:hypothetical protein
MRKTLRAVVGAFLVTAFTFAFAGVASADRSWINDCDKEKGEYAAICDIWWTEGSTQAPVIADALFHSWDESAEVNDYKADGKGVYMRLTWTVDGTKHVRHLYSYKGNSRGNYVIPEGTPVYIHACQTDDGDIGINCRNEAQNA